MAKAPQTPPHDDNVSVLYCKHGHAMTRANTYIRPNDERKTPLCKECRKASHTGKRKRDEAQEHSAQEHYESPHNAFTLKHFRKWCRSLILEDEETPLQIEEFQAYVSDDLFVRTDEGLPLFNKIWMVVPEENGKTTLAAAFALYHAAHTPSPFVPIGASTREQAEIMYRQAEGFVLRSPAISGQFKCLEGYRRIKSLVTHGRIQVYAADDRTADGVIPTLALLDELHRHRNLRLYRTWSGKLRKRNGQLLVISTAGEPGSEFEETRDKIRKEAKKRNIDGAYGRYEDGQLVLHDWAVRERKLCDDMEEVAAANPKKDLTPAVLKPKFDDLSMTMQHWQRFVCNLATRASQDGVTPEQWEMLEEKGIKPDIDSWSCGWVDMGWRIDCTAIGMLTWESSERRIIHNVLIIAPGPDAPVSEEAIARGILERQLYWEPRGGWVYDPNSGGQQMVEQLDRGEHPLQQMEEFSGKWEMEFHEHDQTNPSMSRASRLADEAMRSGWIYHDGDPGLRRHVLNAVRRELGAGKFRYDRPADATGEQRKKYPIDAFTGWLFGHHHAFDNAEDDGDIPLVRSGK